jgi:hypothetical protein
MGGKSDVNVLFSHSNPASRYYFVVDALGKKLSELKGVVNRVVLEEIKICVQISVKGTVCDLSRFSLVWCK